MNGVDESDFEKRALAWLEESASFASAIAAPEVSSLAARAGALLGATLSSGGTVFFCGNGGSAADAQHLAAELVGRLVEDRGPLRGIALTTDTSVLTALGNDYGYDEVFARQLRGLARRGDALVAITTSGRSPNVIAAARAARESGAGVVALCGPDPSPLDEIADVAIHAPGRTSGHVQQGHITIGHLLCALAESAAGQTDPRP